MGSSSKKKSMKTKVIAVVIAIAIVLVVGFLNHESFDTMLPKIASIFGIEITPETVSKPEATKKPETTGAQNGENKNTGKTADGNYTDDSMEVYFFDVGQADAILVMTGGKTMLVDTGNAGDAEVTDKLTDKINLTHELKRLGVEKIDILVATHPHEDHMGSMYKIVKAFDVEDVYITAWEEKFSKNYYDRFWEAVEEKDVHVISPTTLSEKEIKAKVKDYNSNLEEGEEKLVYNASDYIRLGDTVDFGNAVVTMIAPASAEYSDTNDYSIVFMVEFEGVRLLLTGDAGKDSEEEMLKFAEETGFNLDCDILKVGHHGSRTANTEEFIAATKPEYAIIMVEEGNSYGLPDEEPIERLEKQNTVIYQTMEVGDIKLLINDGSYQFDFSYDYEVK